MKRPTLSSLGFLGVGLGVAGGALEVGLRAAPVHGMSLREVAIWIGVAIPLAVGWQVAAAVGAWAVGWRARGLVFGALIALHLGLWYRFEIVLNAFVREPRVWGGLAAIALGSALVGAVLDRALRQARPVAMMCAVVTLVGLGLALVRSGAPAGTPRGDRTNVVIITLDTTRMDALSPYGAARTTPAADRLATEGVVFDQAIATAPLTEPSHLAIMTGLPPYASGVVSNATNLGDRPELLSRVLHQRGYTTAGFVAGFPLHGKYGWTQGMDVYDDDFGQLRGLHRLSLVKLIDNLVLPQNTLRERPGSQVLSRTLSWLDGHHEEAFFLWVHLFDAHGPYEAPGQTFDPPTDGAGLDLPRYWPPPHRAITSTRWLTDAYLAEVHHADELVGQLLDALDTYNISEDTLVVLTADHGESLTEHDYLFDHGDHLYDPSLRVPLIMRGPGVVAGGRVACQVSTADVAPTVLDVLGVDDGADRIGVSRAAELQGGACAEALVVASTIGGRFVAEPPTDHALRTSGHKYIKKGPLDGQEQSALCFDLQQDPAEGHDLVADPASGCPPDLAGALQRALDGGVAPQAPQLDAESMDMLEALGYVE